MKKFKINNTARFIIFAIILIGIVAVIFGSSATDKNPIGPSSQSTTNVKSQPLKETEGELLTTIDKLWLSVDSTLKDRSKIEIDYDKSSKTAFITHVNENPYKAADVVQQAWAILALWGSDVAKLSSVKNINIQNKTNFLDSYGNSSIGTGIVIDMKSSQVTKFNWKSLNYQNIEERIRSKSTIYRVVPALRNEINPDDLYLVLKYP